MALYPSPVVIHPVLINYHVVMIELAVYVNLTKIIMMATTRRMWMKPPIVTDVMTPRSQRIINMTAIVVNITLIF